MSESPLGLEGKVVVVTGASQGVGHGCAREFARAGAKVVVVARGRERAEAAASALAAAGNDALAIEADATRPEDLARVAEETVAHFGRLDVAVNNVGGRSGSPEGTLLESGPDYWSRTLELNLMSVLAGSQAFARAMIACGNGGVILNIGSVSGLGASPGLAPYGAAKAGLVQLTKTLALELAPHGIRVNGVSPGMVDTDSLRAFLSESDLLERGRSVPMGRVAQPEDIGKAAVLLASDLAGWVTGSTLVADGGEHLLRRE